MRWICPRCRSAVSLAFQECPYCPPTVSELESSQAPPANKAVAAPAALPAPSAAPERLKPASVSPALPARAPATRPLSTVPRRAVLAEEEQESALMRGFRMGVGFMLAVVTILLLLVLLLLWLSTQPGWKEWLERFGI